jgi:hypothetical protein
MDTRIVQTIAQMAAEDYLSLPCASPDAVEERRAAVEAAGLDWLATLRWLAENREKIFAMVKEATDLFQSFPRPKGAAEASPDLPAGKAGAIDPVTIITLITTLAPLIEQLIAAFRKRRNPPQPGPGPVTPPPRIV